MLGDLAVEEVWEVKFDILDHGYIELVETWGSDERIIEAARMSTNKGFKGWGNSMVCNRCSGTGRMWDNGDKTECNVEGCKDGVIGTVGDEKLLRYLYTHKHMTPFEMAGMIIEVQAPIMVFREWHRHRTQSYNEMSGRYTVLPSMFYTPSIDRIKNGGQSKTNKQGSGEQLSDEDVQRVLRYYREAFESARMDYEDLIQSVGLSKELARLVLPVAQYSKMRASANLRNWLAFLTLRMDEAAQWEIRQYANFVAEIIKAHFPRTYSLFDSDR